MVPGPFELMTVCFCFSAMTTTQAYARAYAAHILRLTIILFFMMRRLI